MGKNTLPGEAIQVELTDEVSNRRVVFDVMAENRPTAVHEARRFMATPGTRFWLGDYDELSSYWKDNFLNDYGVVGWRAYRVETVAV